VTTPETVKLGGAVHKAKDGSYVVVVQVQGLTKESEATVILQRLQPIVNETVSWVLSRRGTVTGDYDPKKLS
jgi:hypothetical protein